MLSKKKIFFIFYYDSFLIHWRSNKMKISNSITWIHNINTHTKCV
jgi:hypothetical protein